MLKVGLTGGIGSGKSTAAQLFEQLGAAVIDTDDISRQLTTEPEIIEQIRQQFGNTVIRPDGSLDRKALASQVFSDTTGKQALEAILHPPIRNQVLNRLNQLEHAPYVIIVVPLLLETDFHKLVDRILVVDSAEETQIRRVTKRDQRSEADIRSIINQQISRQQRLTKADDILHNDSTLDALRQAVVDLHQRYLAI